MLEKRRETAERTNTRRLTQILFDVPRTTHSLYNLRLLYLKHRYVGVHRLKLARLTWNARVLHDELLTDVSALVGGSRAAISRRKESVDSRNRYRWPRKIQVCHTDAAKPAYPNPPFELL